MNLPHRTARATATAAALTLAVGAAVATAGAAGAATTSKVWSSTVTYGWTDHTVDGDTVAVKVDGDPSTVEPPHVRNAGIQTMELGTCHADEATRSMSSLVAGKRVRMTTSSTSASSLGRPVRHIDVSTGSGWLDTQLVQLQRGHALPVILARDDTRWKQYFTAAQQAARAGANLFDTDYCRSGPVQSAPLRVWVSWDANGDDAGNVNGEYVRVLNSGSTAISLSRWQVRTGGQDSFTFPTNATVPAGGVLTLRVGRGTSTSTTFYWGSTAPKFPNASVALNRYGSGAYLFDPDGDLRAWSIYPCMSGCTSSLADKVWFSVRADANGVDADNVNGEYVAITVKGTTSINLQYQVLAANGYTYEFPKGSVVRPGEKLVVHLGKGTTSRLRHYWGNSNPVLSNTGGAVELRTPDATRILCRAWGTGRC